jgi:hypothetical protein
LEANSQRKNRDSQHRNRQASNALSEESSTVAEDPLFRDDPVLSSIELELAWLGEESMHSMVAPCFQFNFVWEYASEGLRVELRKVNAGDKTDGQWYTQVVGEDWLVRRRFEVVREKIRFCLRRGMRREQMANVIADLRLRQRHLAPAARVFPAMRKAPSQKPFEAPDARKRHNQVETTP